MAINEFFPCSYRYPFTNDHELNLGWVLATIKAQESELSKFVALNTVKYADPFDWNITSQYATNTVVFNPADMTAYLSVQPVPSGVQIDNTNYWTPIFTLADIFTAYKTSITPVEQIAAKPATQAISKGQLLWIDNVLYAAVRDIAQGTVVVPGENVLLTNISDELAAEQTAREQADTQLQSNITAEQTAREQADTVLQTNITNMTPAYKKQYYNTAKICFVGDSIAAGWGWWNGIESDRNTTNDGFAPYFRNALPDANIANVSVSGTTIANNFAGYSSLSSQIVGVTGQDVIFVCCGVNDETAVFNGSVSTNRLGVFPSGLSGSYTGNADTTYGNFVNIINTLRQNNPAAEIIYIAVNSSDNADYYKWYAHMDNIKRLCQILGIRVFDCDRHIPRFETPLGSAYYNSTSRVHYSQQGYALLSPDLFSFMLYDGGSECEPVTDILFSYNSDADLAKTVQSLLDIYKFWWTDGSFRMASPGPSEAYGLEYVTMSQNGGNATIFVHGPYGARRYIYLNSNLAEMPVFSYEPAPQNITSIRSIVLPGAYFIPAANLPNMTDIPTELKNTAEGDLYVLMIGYSTGLMYQPLGSSTGKLYRFTIAPSDIYFWKINETLQS